MKRAVWFNQSLYHFLMPLPAMWLVRLTWYGLGLYGCSCVDCSVSLEITLTCNIASTWLEQNPPVVYGVNPVASTPSREMLLASITVTLYALLFNSVMPPTL